MRRMLLIGVLVSALLLPWGCWPAAPAARADEVEAMCTSAVSHQAFLTAWGSQRFVKLGCADQAVQTLDRWTIPMSNGTLYVIEQQLTLCVTEPPTPTPEVTPTPTPTPLGLAFPAAPQLPVEKWGVANFRFSCSVLSATDEQGMQRDVILSVSETSG